MEWDVVGANDAHSYDGAWLLDIGFRSGRYHWWVKGPPDVFVTMDSGQSLTMDGAKLAATRSFARLKAKRAEMDEVRKKALG